MLVAQQQNAPSETSRYNITWLISQAGVEFARLQAAVGAAAVPDAPSGVEDVQLRFDILVNRVHVLEAGDVQTFIRSDPEFEAIVAQLADTLAQGQPLVDRFEQAGSASQLTDLLAPLNAKLARLASAANIRSGDMVASFQQELNFLYGLFQAVLAGLVICGFGLIASLRQQNGDLRRAHAAGEILAVHLRQTGERFDAALSNMAQGLCLFDAEERLIVHNQCFARMFGAPTPGVSAAALAKKQSRNEMFAPPGSTGCVDEDRRTYELDDGRVIQVSRQAVPGEGWVATFEDVTERRRSQEQLSHMMRHDALTGLPNRVLFREHIERVLPRMRRGGNTAVFCLDLDGFKSVNDTLGHPAGDELLRLVACRLRDNTHEMDLVARLGGDEFAIIQADAQQPAEATSLADRLVAALKAPFDLLGQQVEIGASIGTVLTDAAEATADELLRNANIALYRAKAEGRGTWRFFDPGMDAEIQQRRLMETDLRRAVANGQFVVYYQPLVDAHTRAPVGFEALMRWQHPERGLVSPTEFIPLAERMGLILDIGAWTLARACTDAASWPKHLKVAVNLSPMQFVGGRLVEEVEQALASSGLAADRLELEITESVLLQDNDVNLGVLHRLRVLGVRISMDDFGTGYSSLSYLRRFPFDKIKIDQSFVRNLEQERGSIEIVRAVVGLGKALGMDVLAEGVETLEQLAILQTEGCDELQGYLFGRPQPLQDVVRVITGHLPGKDGAARGPLLVVDKGGVNQSAA
ncbi:MAG TPA: EAL domain-containing protein [Acetobacteraceae bacterium]